MPTAWECATVHIAEWRDGVDRSLTARHAGPMSREGALFLVDDNAEDIDLSSLLIRRADPSISLETFVSGDRVIERLSEISGDAGAILPLALILDAKMPGLTGLDVLEWVREHALFDRMPVVMWSSSDDPSDLARAARHKAQCYLAKYPTVPVIRDVLTHARRFRAGSFDGDFPLTANLLTGRNALPDLSESRSSAPTRK